jgi:hypothetical protein
VDVQTCVTLLVTMHFFDQEFVNGFKFLEIFN